MSTIVSLFEKVQKEGLTLEVHGEKLRVIAPPGKAIPKILVPELTKYKHELISHLKDFKPSKPSSKQRIAQALKRLELGECDSIRIYSHALKEELYMVRDDFDKGTLPLELPAYTLSELKKLIGIGKEELKKVHLIKKEFKAKAV